MTADPLNLEATLDMTRSAGDYYHLDDLLTPEEREVRYRTREFFTTEIEPIITPYWEKAEFPHEVIPKFRAFGYGGGMLKGYGCAGISPVASGVMGMEMSRVDGSMSTFYGVHNGLAMGSIGLLGSDEQKERWLPPMANYDKLGCFGLTEPNVGSNSWMMETTFRKDGDHYILNGAKRWIGNATLADIAVIWARNEEDGKVSGFVVELPTPGFSAKKIEYKIAKRAIHNADIRLESVRVPAENRLALAASSKATGQVLVMTRVGVAWEAVGHGMAGFEIALDYAKKRQQFGKPIAGFQMIQEKLAKMLGEVTAMTYMTYRLSQMMETGKLTDAHASLAKMHNAAKAREVVAMSREILGGNGILLDYKAARHFADVEAVYTYEGTNEVQTLIVGRDITGIQAFVG
jgi:glutaryl-CoA dehydrogenase